MILVSATIIYHLLALSDKWARVKFQNWKRMKSSLRSLHVQQRGTAECWRARKWQFDTPSLTCAVSLIDFRLFSSDLTPSTSRVHKGKLARIAVREVVKYLYTDPVIMRKHAAMGLPSSNIALTLFFDTPIFIADPCSPGQMNHRL